MPTTASGRVSKCQLRLELLEIGNYWVYLKLVVPVGLLFKSEVKWLYYRKQFKILGMVATKIIVKPGFVSVNGRDIAQLVFSNALKYHRVAIIQGMVKSMTCADFFYMLFYFSGDPDYCSIIIDLIKLFPLEEQNYVAQYFAHQRLCLTSDLFYTDTYECCCSITWDSYFGLDDSGLSKCSYKKVKVTMNDLINQFVAGYWFEPNWKRFEKYHLE